MSDTKDSQITVYSATWCGFCHQAKKYFDHIGVTYTDKDIEKEPAAMGEAVAKSGQMGIPVIDIAGDVIIGFDKQKIDAALKTHHLVK